MLLGNHLHRPSPERVHLSRLRLPLSPCPQPRATTTILLCVSVTLTSPGASRKWAHTVLLRLCLASLT